MLPTKNAAVLILESTPIAYQLYLTTLCTSIHLVLVSTKEKKLLSESFTNSYSIQKIDINDSDIESWHPLQTQSKPPKNLTHSKLFLVELHILFKI